MDYDCITHHHSIHFESFENHSSRQKNAAKAPIHCRFSVNYQWNYCPRIYPYRSFGMTKLFSFFSLLFSLLLFALISPNALAQSDICPRIYRENENIRTDPA
jgi:hypothetical protein